MTVSAEPCVRSPHFGRRDVTSPEAYLWFKTLHIVGVVVWFAGLFYLVELFIYHVETAELADELQQLP